jgi:hypothetical protein
MLAQKLFGFLFVFYKKWFISIAPYVIGYNNIIVFLFFTRLSKRAAWTHNNLSVPLKQKSLSLF